MLTFLHLSDIHFRSREGGAQFDLDEQTREALLADISSKPADRAEYDGLLISGDIAFGGKKAEYGRAKDFLERIYCEARLLPEYTYLVPGNHDVDRDFVVPGGAIWNNHAALRAEKNKVLRYQLLQTQLTHDPACNPLAPLAAYNEFAQGYGCRTEKDRLAWSEIFPKRLDDGAKLRLHGLNSALNSDEGDEIPQLFVSPFQTQHFRHQADCVELVLCHHPPHWLLDMVDVEGALNSYASVGLFGHEHNHRSRMVNKTVQLFAGAVHPAARDPDWLPTYHIVQLSVEVTGEQRELLVRIFSRELRSLEHAFVPRMSISERDFEDYRVKLPDWAGSSNVLDAVPNPEVGSTQTMPSPKSQPTSNLVSTGLRELLVHFHRLSTPVRYNIATKLDLLRDGDDVPPQQQWDLVFQRAQEEGRVAELWKEVAKHDIAFASRTNPFV